MSVPLAARADPQPVTRVTGASVRGAAHVREGLPNQDGLGIWQDAQPFETAIIAVADGHGNARHFRSATGSRLAVDTAIEVLRGAAPELESADAQLRSALAARELPARIVTRWRERVLSDIAQTPITPREWEQIEALEGASALASVQRDPVLAYGTTLLAGLVTRDLIVLVQVGDGDVLLVAADGTTSRPIPRDDRLVGEITTSMCRQGAEADFRHAVLPIHAANASLLALCTDGYCNSFDTDADFLKVGTDLLDMIRSEGVAAVGKRLPAFLEHASTSGSGDDITMALAYLESADAPRPRGTSTSASRPVATRSEVKALRGELSRATRQLTQIKQAAVIAVIIALGAAAWMFRGHIVPKAQPISRPMPAAPDPVGISEPASIVLSARHSQRGVEADATITFAGAPPPECTAQVSVSAPKFPNLGSSALLPVTLPADKDSIDLHAISISLPKSSKESKAMKGPDTSATLEVTCQGKRVAHKSVAVKD